MTSTPVQYFYKNLSLCAYVGNTSSLDDKVLLDYCSSFGTITTSSFGREKFCDFRILEFANNEQLRRFVNEKSHTIDKIALTVKSYKSILINPDALHIERKFFVGPIINPDDIVRVVHFYKAIDSTLHYYVSRQAKEAYLLFELGNRQSVTRIFEKQTIPITNEHRKFTIHKPMHPNQFVSKIISMKNKQSQICIRGLIDSITETMLIDYFHKRAPVIACRILPNNPACAIIEFNDKETVKKVLDTPRIRYQEVNLLLSEAPEHFATLLSPNDKNEESDDDDDDDDEIRTTSSTLKRLSHTSPAQSQPYPSVSSTMHQKSIPQPTLHVNLVPSLSTMKSGSVSSAHESSDNTSGWSSPPRAVISYAPSIDEPTAQSSSNLCASATDITNDRICQSGNADTDTKPIRKLPSNDLLRFAEQCQTQLDQIKDEYVMKFAEDRTYIEQEINILISDERQTFDKLNRYLNDQRRRAEKRNNKRRKHSLSSSAH